MSQIKFGTDGWRAVTADAFTFDNLDRVAQATADFWKRNPVPGTDAKVVVGYDSLRLVPRKSWPGMDSKSS